MKIQQKPKVQRQTVFNFVKGKRGRSFEVFQGCKSLLLSADQFITGYAQHFVAGTHTQSNLYLKVALKELPTNLLIRVESLTQVMTLKMT